MQTPPTPQSLRPLPSPSPDPLIGTAYRTLRTLDAGGMGLVLEAEHLKLGKRVCVKVLRDPSPDFVDRMTLEARSLAALSGHPHVVLATDFGETPDGQPFLVMERLFGRTLLEERKARGPLPPLEAIDFACQALDGLEGVHAAGVVHRDIKPGNLFVCNGRDGGRRLLKILDFGAAKLADRVESALNGDAASPPSAVSPRGLQTEQGVVIGSPRYMAPEQIASGATVDHRADLYAMGAVLFSMLTGRGPFDDRKDHVAIVLGHLHGVPPAPSTLSPYKVPEALDRAVLRALAKKPGDRFADARSFAEELAQIGREIAGGHGRAKERRGAAGGAMGREATDRLDRTVEERTAAERTAPLPAFGEDPEPTVISASSPPKATSPLWRHLGMGAAAVGGVLTGALLGLYLLGVIR